MPKKATVAKKKPKGPGGRPSGYSQEIAARICEKLSEGESLRTVCKADDMPNMSSVFKWMTEHEEFSVQYARAKKEGAEAWAEEILDISDDGTNDWMEKLSKEGDSLGWVVNGEAIQRSKLRVDSRKWLMSKLLPKKYGEKLDIEHSGEVKVSLWDRVRGKE